MRKFVAAVMGVIGLIAFALHNAFEHNYPDSRDGIIALVNVGLVVVWLVLARKIVAGYVRLSAG